MTSNNYVTILGWMTNLNIKGNELIVYAIIHGFSQDNDSYFYGSLNYLAQWTGTTEQCMADVLKKLGDKGLVERIVREGKTNLYRTINPFEQGNCIINNEKPKRKRIRDVDKYKTEVEEVISYLNNKLGSRYTSKSITNNKLIISKIKDGFTVEDFKNVIDKKYAEWNDNPDFSRYLRPQTLFGDKFENYVNQESTSKNLSSYTIHTDNTDSFDSDEKVAVNTSIVY